jgi:hypothetical protein
MLTQNFRFKLQGFCPPLILATMLAGGTTSVIDSDLITQAVKHILFVWVAIMPPSEGQEPRATHVKDVISLLLMLGEAPQARQVLP